MAALTQRKKTYEEEQNLTEKQAAILAAFDEDSTRSFAEVADAATETLEGDESVTSSYVSEQLKQRRPEHFDEDGKRLDSEDVDTSGGLEEAMQEEEIETQEQVERVREREEDDNLIAVEMSQGKWLRMIALFHLFANTEEGESHEETLMELANIVASQSVPRSS